MTPQRSDSEQPRTANDNTGDSLRDGMAAAYNRGLADGRAEAGAASPSEPLRAALEEVSDRLESVWNRMEPGIWTDDPSKRALGGQVEEVVQGVYFALERAHAALAAPSQEPPWKTHNHGPAEGRGTACREYHLNGRLVGACLIVAATSEERASEPAGLDVLRTRRVLCEMEHEIRHPGNGVAESCIECLRAADGLIADLTASAAAQEDSE